jgi:DNA primase
MGVAVDKAQIDRLKEVVDIVELIGATMALEKRGSNWLGLCPFHQEKTPSFNVNPTRGSYYCFGCHAKGDAISWVQEQDSLSFPEAVQRLAERSGIHVSLGGGPARARTPEEDAERRFLDDARRLAKDAAALFVDALAAPVGEQARAYLRGRGLSRRAIANARIGFAPVDALRHLDAPDVLLEAAGLVAGQKFLFAHRIVLPICDEQGRVIAFSGRQLPGATGAGKYVNSPSTPLYEKHRVLYALDRAKRALRADKPLILCEGPMDVIALEQYGIEGAIASSGTAFTREQAALIARRCGGVAPIILFDGDRAGREATEKAARLLLECSLNVRRLSLPTGEDPDSWVRAIGQEDAQTALTQSPAVLDEVASGVAEAASETVDELTAREGLASGWLAHLPAGPLRLAFAERVERVLGRRPQAKVAPGLAPPPSEDTPPASGRPDRLVVPPAVQAARAAPRVAALWNHWVAQTRAHYGEALDRWCLELPELPPAADWSEDDGQAAQTVVRGVFDLMVRQAKTVLRFQHGDEFTAWREAEALCRTIHTQTRAHIAELDAGLTAPEA